MDLVIECLRGNLKNIKHLVEQGEDISVYEYEPLRIAAYYGYFEVVKYLVEKGAYISICNYAPLRYAVNYRYFEIINYYRQMLGDEIPCHECLVRSACLELCF